MRALLKMTTLMMMVSCGIEDLPVALPEEQAIVEEEIVEEKNGSTSVNAVSNVMILLKGSSLPDCIEDLEGQTLFVQDDEEFYVCTKNEKWAKINLNGKKGSGGDDGKDGVDGVDGEDGVDGTNAEDGVNGENGTNGLDGDDGVNGTNGEDGGSAYDVWLEVGNTGTYSEFIASIKGVKGDNGSNGSDGINGANGNDGAAGTNGANGNDGAAGTNGANGNDGAAGANGANGNDGAAGANGSDGAAGANGSDGATGSDGTNGSDGAGAAGWEKITANINVSAGSQGTLSMSCTGTKKAVGGGCTMAHQDSHIHQSYPGSDGQSWVCRAKNNSGNTDNFDGYVICLDAAL